MRAAHKRRDRVDAHVDRERAQADRDELLRPALGRLRAGPAAGVEPQDRAGGGQLDQRVKPEGEQCDRAGDQGRDDGDTGLHRHPPNAQQRERPRTPAQPLAILARRRRDEQTKRSERSHLHDRSLTRFERPSVTPPRGRSDATVAFAPSIHQPPGTPGQSHMNETQLSHMNGIRLSQIDGTPHQGLPTRTRLAAGVWHNWQLWETDNIDVPGRHFTTYDH